MTTTTTAPDFTSMRNRINDAWNQTLVRMDQNRRNYLTQMGFDPAGQGSFVSQAASLAQGRAMDSPSVSSLRWSSNPYSALSNLMRQGGAETQAIRDNAHYRGLSGGAVNQQLANIDFARTGQINQFAQGFTDTMSRMRQAALDAGNQYNNNIGQVNQAETDYNLEQLYNQNAADPTPPAATTPDTLGPVMPSGGWVQADKLIAQLKARPGKSRKNLDAIYAYIRRNKGSIDPVDMKMLNKLAAQYRTSIQKNHRRGTMTAAHGQIGYITPHANTFGGR